MKNKDIKEFTEQDIKVANPTQFEKGSQTTDAKGGMVGTASQTEGRARQSRRVCLEALTSASENLHVY